MGVLQKLLDAGGQQNGAIYQQIALGSCDLTVSNVRAQLGARMLQGRIHDEHRYHLLHPAYRLR
jgi:hypothetical protein